jgi:DNA-directed RNA polymerase subunit beta
LDVKILTEDAQEILIRDTEDDIHETAKELDFNLGSEAMVKRVPEQNSDFRVDELEDDSSDDLEPIEEELDIIAEIGDMGTERTDAPANDGDLELLSRRPGLKKVKAETSKKHSSRHYLDEMDDNTEE